ncbi:hypothetical protein M0R45_036062 [Rubus argutus]|uniref:Glycoside hydrolase family 3 N-terminal domain-containing protein n=1 Tax=Rubus argutus TaxID=59490 RepID=A0AAW1W0H3_RUBAR
MSIMLQYFRIMLGWSYPGILNWYAELVLQQLLKSELRGIPYVFAPCIAVCRDPRWGRCYESYSEDHRIVQEMTEIIPGLQGDIPANSRKGVPYVGGNKKVAACAKHFVGDGGTIKGMNENNTVVDRHDLLSIHMPAYSDSIIKGVSTVMISYSSWNGEKMHANRDLVTGFLKNTLKFKLELTCQSWKDSACQVYHGSFENPLSDLSLVNELGSQAHRDLAREAVRNGGGWTIAWQGFSGNNYTRGTTILGAIKSTVKLQLVIFGRPCILIVVVALILSLRLKLL